IDWPDDEYEVLVDAHSSELLAVTDMKHYSTRKVGGGVYPVSNDGNPPDGIEQLNWPMPFANVSISGGGTVYTTSGGHLPEGTDSGTITTTLSGQYVRMSDRCGT